MVNERGDAVAAVGVRDGRHLLGITALLEAGYPVLAFDPRAYMFGPLQGDERVQLDKMSARWPTRFRLVEELIDGESEGLLATADGTFGRAHVVYLGTGWGADAALVGGFMAALANRGGGELIATEAAARTADHVLRWMAHWAAQPSPGTVHCVTLREPQADPFPADTFRGAGHAWEVLVAAGWEGPLSLEEADQIARRRVVDGSDLLAGRRWRYVGTGDVDTGRCAVGDAAALAETLDAGGRLPEDTDADPPETVVGQRYVVAWIPGGDWPFGVEITPPEGPVEAVRVSFDGDAFDFPDLYRPIGTIEISTGRLIASDPLYLHDSPVEIDIPPGPWVVEHLTHEGELEGIRLRRLPVED